MRDLRLQLAEPLPLAILSRTWPASRLSSWTEMSDQMTASQSSMRSLRLLGGHSLESRTDRQTDLFLLFLQFLIRYIISGTSSFLIVSSEQTLAFRLAIILRSRSFFESSSLRARCAKNRLSPPQATIYIFEGKFYLSIISTQRTHQKNQVHSLSFSPFLTSFQQEVARKQLSLGMENSPKEERSLRWKLVQRKRLSLGRAESVLRMSVMADLYLLLFGISSVSTSPKKAFITTIEIMNQWQLASYGLRMSPRVFLILPAFLSCLRGCCCWSGLKQCLLGTNQGRVQLKLNLVHDFL